MHLQRGGEIRAGVDRLIKEWHQWHKMSEDCQREEIRDDGCLKKGPALD